MCIFGSAGRWSDQINVPEADPAVQALINELGLRESPTASRDLPGWNPPKKIVVRQGRSGALEEYQAIAPDVEFVMVEKRGAGKERGGRCPGRAGLLR